jgi:hypothetical protein
MNFKKVIELAQNDQLPGLDKKDLPLEGEIPGLDTCMACIAGKSKHLPFKVGWERAVRPYEWVHVDFLGPMPEESAGGSKYIWLAVDDATQYTYIKPAACHAEAGTIFREYKAVVETESGGRLAEVMTNNVKELSEGEIGKFCKEWGICISTMVLYHPSSNGVVERHVGMLTETARTMLHDSGLPQRLWLRHSWL